MHLKLLTILTIFSLAVSGQDSLYFVGVNHNEYTIQQGFDTASWWTVGTLKGDKDSNYAYPIVGPDYYYRVYADKDTSGWMLAYSTLSITPDSVYHPKNDKVKSFSFKVWQGIELQFEVKSERVQQAVVKITDMLGQVIEAKTVTLREGTNAFSMIAPMTGFYAISIETYFDFQTKKIFVK